MLKSEKNSTVVTELSQSCDQLRKELAVVTKQKNSMETLCRKLTQERAELKEKLKNLGGDEASVAETGAEDAATSEARKEATAAQDSAGEAVAASQ
jgi:peptidoglycan hydrolase CwlO-like protein